MSDWKDADTSSNIETMLETMNIEFQWDLRYGYDVDIRLYCHNTREKRRKRERKKPSEANNEISNSSSFSVHFVECFYLLCFALFSYSQLNKLNNDAQQQNLDDEVMPNKLTKSFKININRENHWINHKIKGKKEMKKNK